MKYLVVGLGNPGQKYIGTRHNIGFSALDWLADEWQAPDFTSSSQAKAAVSDFMIESDKVLLAKPQTFMNNSGEAVQALSNYYSIPSGHIMVLYDDVDLPLADLRIACNRGSGGHRGLQSVVDKLGTKNFFRLRIGISPTNESGQLDKQTVPGKGINPFVMSQFSSEEVAHLEAVYPDIQSAIESWITTDGEAAMNEIN